MGKLLDPKALDSSVKMKTSKSCFVKFCSILRIFRTCSVRFFSEKQNFWNVLDFSFGSFPLLLRFPRPPEKIIRSTS